MAAAAVLEVAVHKAATPASSNIIRPSPTLSRVPLTGKRSALDAWTALRWKLGISDSDRAYLKNLIKVCPRDFSIIRTIDCLSLWLTQLVLPLLYLL